MNNNKVKNFNDSYYMESVYSQKAIEKLMSIEENKKSGILILADENKYSPPRIW